MFSDHKRIKLEVNKNGNRKISKCLNAKQYTSKQSMVKEEEEVSR